MKVGFPSLAHVSVHASFLEGEMYKKEKIAAKELLDKTYGDVRIKKLIHQKGSLVSVKFRDKKGIYLKRCIEWKGGNLILLPIPQDEQDVKEGGKV